MSLWSVLQGTGREKHSNNSWNLRNSPVVRLPPVPFNGVTAEQPLFPSNEGTAGRQLHSIGGGFPVFLGERCDPLHKCETVITSCYMAQQEEEISTSWISSVKYHYYFFFWVPQTVWVGSLPWSNLTLHPAILIGVHLTISKQIVLPESLKGPMLKCFAGAGPDLAAGWLKSPLHASCVGLTTWVPWVCGA